MKKATQANLVIYFRKNKKISLFIGAQGFWKITEKGGSIFSCKNGKGVAHKGEFK